MRLSESLNVKGVLLIRSCVGQRYMLPDPRNAQYRLIWSAFSNARPSLVKYQIYAHNTMLPHCHDTKCQRRTKLQEKGYVNLKLHKPKNTTPHHLILPSQIFLLTVNFRLIGAAGNASANVSLATQLR